MSAALLPDTTTIQRLNELLTLLQIKEAYYVDDYNGLDHLPYVQTVSKTLFVEEKIDDLTSIFGELLNTDVPSEDEIGQQLYTLWDGVSDPIKLEILEKIHAKGDSEFNKLDFTGTKELQKSFPEGVLRLVSPDGWDELFSRLNKDFQGDGKVLILFDQDLSKANGERFRNKSVRGQDLIVAVKSSKIKDNVFCALITHLIQSTSKELDARDVIIDELDGKLSKGDFLALTKDRITNPELFCDGIKKALLNTYFEIIKAASKEIITEAQRRSSAKFESLDTYDFDHTILQSSQSEGIWEANTIFRITANIFEQEVKMLMLSENYAKRINPILKSSKPISDIKFILPNEDPYLEKYKLRHLDIYETGDIINNLHSPIENGDIFQVTEGVRQGFYILVGQECDLMMRSTGSRSTEVSTFLKIKIYNKEVISGLISKSDHYFGNKFGLQYFNVGTNEIGIVSFLESTSINLNMLDLCIFNNQGEATIDVNSSFDVMLLNTSWENRYKKIIQNCANEARKLDDLLPVITPLHKTKREPILRKLYPNLGTFSALGIQNSYAHNVFKFGCKRIMRLKNSGATLLLERYYRHLSRTAEPHDFAK